MTDTIDPEMVSGEIIARRAARDAKARLIAGRAIPWWLLVFPVGVWLMAGYVPYGAAISAVVTFGVVGWLMYSINQRFDAVVRLIGGADQDDQCGVEGMHL
jgi:hypothetical protein